MTSPTKDEFAKLLADRIRQAGESGRIDYDAEGFSIQGEGARAFRLWLGNAYKEYCAAAGDQREQQLKHYVQGWLNLPTAVPKDFGDVKTRLLPVVRSRSYFTLTNLRDEVRTGEPGSLQYRPLGEHFGVGLAYDMPDSLRFIPKTSLDGWGVTLAEALEIAKKNLAAMPVKFVGPRSGPGAYFSATGDRHDASRLLLTDFIRRFNVKGDHVALLPNADCVAVVGSEDDAGLTRLVGMTAKALEQPRPISGIALRLEGNGWVPWLPDTSRPLFKDFQRLYLQSLGEDYAEQTDLLDKLHAKRGEDIFVAPFSATQLRDGKVVSWATWAAEVTHTLLPKSDVLMLGRRSARPRMVPWEKAVDVLGDRLEPLDIYPPRYRVREFPTERQLAAMGDTLQ